MCLDWREVCDGKTDCINGGVDEQNCFDLKINERGDNEYRCQNALCIPEGFLCDDRYNPKCLDQTDEGFVSWYPRQCSSGPSFRCDEHTCNNFGLWIVGFPCDDGECSSFEKTCTNERGSWV